jgi:hypothetical protein
MIKKFIEWTRWSSLGAMLSNNTARAIYALPIAGYVILYSDYFRSLFKFSVLSSSWGFLTFTERVNMIYYVALFLLLAFGLFWVFSPPLLRNKRDRQHFVSDIIVSRDSSTARRIISELITYVDQLVNNQLDITTQRISDKLSSQVRHRVDAVGENAEEYESLISDFLLYYYDWENNDKPKRRALIFLTCVGYFLLLLPSFDLFLRVLGTNLRGLFG